MLTEVNTTREQLRRRRGSLIRSEAQRLCEHENMCPQQASRQIVNRFGPSSQELAEAVVLQARRQYRSPTRVGAAVLKTIERARSHIPQPPQDPPDSI